MTREEAEEEYNEQLDIEIRKYLESHKLPQQLVEEIARKYLNIAYIRERIREVYPGYLKDISTHFNPHKYEQEHETYKRYVRQEE